MTLRFPYLDEPLQGPPPPSLPKSAQERWRPIVPITVYGPLGHSVFIQRALIDSGADDTVLPLSVAAALGIPLLATTSGFGMRWRGQRFPLQFGIVELELIDAAGAGLRWCATVGFASANMRYPVLGMCGCLAFLDVRFLGKDRILEVEANASLPVII